ncbi:MAG: hypothetical protein KIT14_21685 [bacterium]|nr:hypothetical protein [bacterium]
MPQHPIVRALALVLALALPGLAAAEEVPAAGASAWRFEVAPYAWLTGTFGTVEVENRTAFVDLTVDDLLTLLFDGDALAGAAWFQASYGRWSAFLDAFGGYVELKTDAKVCCTTLDAKLTMYPVAIDVGFGYQLGAWTLRDRRRPLTLGVYAGTRIMHLGNVLRADTQRPGVVGRALAADEAFDWADPMIGVRWEVPVHDRLSLDFRGDIGGFGASSDLIWGLVGGVRWWLPWSPWGSQPWLGLGYRAISFDHDFGPDSAGNLEMRGPYSALGFAF